jgi:hypothetical protein
MGSTFVGGGKLSDSKELVTIIRPSFMKFCQDGCRAATFNHILYWIARKSFDEKVPREKAGTDEITWYATTEEITEGMSHAWGECKVRKEVNNIIGMGIIGRGSNPAWGADRTKHFYFGPEQCAKLLSLFQEYTICLYCLGLPSEVVQIIHLSNAKDKIMICKCLKHQMEMMNVSDASDRSIRAITKDSTKVTSKVTNKEEESASPLHPLWILWRSSINRPTDQFPIERDLNYCLEIEEMCKNAKIELTIELIHQRRDQFKQNNPEKTGWHLGNFVTEMRNYLDQLQPAQPGQDLSEILLWTRYSHLPNFDTSIDLWFLFEYMTRMEALNYGIADNGELFGKKLYAIEDRLKASDEVTKRGLIDLWVSERMAIAV